MSRQLKGICHHDTPVSSDADVGAEIRERARQTCGFHPNQDAFGAHREIESGGGPEAVVKRAAQRAERDVETAMQTPRREGGRQ